MSGFVRRFFPVWLVGLVGVLVLAIQPPPAFLFEQAPELRALPPIAVRLLLIVNPLVLLTIAAIVGALAAHRAGLGSRLAGTLPTTAASRAGRWVGVSVLSGLVAAAVLVGLDRLFAPVLGEGFPRLAAGGPDAIALAFGVLYGGLTEEVLMRWGLMSLVLLGALRLHRALAVRDANDARPPPAWIPWIAIVVAAVVFAAGHLPAVAATTEPTSWLVARTLLLNAIGGIVYGWLYWRHGLEAAMIAHASTHGGFYVASLL